MRVSSEVDANRQRRKSEQAEQFGTGNSCFEISAIGECFRFLSHTGMLL